MVHTLVGILLTTKVYSALANIAKAERMKHVAIARHALKIMKKREHLEQAKKPSAKCAHQSSNRFYCGLFQRVTIALLEHDW